MRPDDADLSQLECLPDSRLTDPKDGPRIEWGKYGRINTIPIFCANCGKLGGYVPEENCTFACYLCDSPCAETYGAIAGTLCMPDEVFWAKVAQEQLDRYGRFLTEQELHVVSDMSTDPLSKLLKESPSHP